MQEHEDCGPVLRIWNLPPARRSSDKVRLLRLDLPGAPLDSEAEASWIPCCEVVEEDIVHLPSFHALSYVWGDQEDVLPIMLDGEIRPVTRNLRYALEDIIQHTLSGKLDHRLLWVDALCINQDDDEEKSEQVLHMGQIYQQAKRVLVSLGCRYNSCGQDTTRGCMQLLKAFAVHAQLPEFQRFTLPWWEADVAEQQKSFIQDSLHFLDHLETNYIEALSLFAQSGSWWRRAWVRQEATLGRASSMRILWGSITLDWHDIRSAVRWLDCIESLFPKRRQFLSNFSIAKQEAIQTLCETLQSIRDFMKATHISTPKTLADQLWSHYAGTTLPLEASLTVDLIYSLLDLSSDKESCSILPIYGRHVAAVYADVARYLARIRHPLGMLFLGLDTQKFFSILGPHNEDMYGKKMELLERGSDDFCYNLNSLAFDNDATALEAVMRSETSYVSVRNLIICPSHSAQVFGSPGSALFLETLEISWPTSRGPTVNPVTWIQNVSRVVNERSKGKPLPIWLNRSLRFLTPKLPLQNGGDVEDTQSLVRGYESLSRNWIDHIFRALHNGSSQSLVIENNMLGLILPCEDTGHQRFNLLIVTGIAIRLDEGRIAAQLNVSKLLEKFRTLECGYWAGVEVEADVSDEDAIAGALEEREATFHTEI